MKLLCGVGYNDRKYPTIRNGKLLKEYQHWRNMLERCYNKKKIGNLDTYMGCKVSENFKSYSYFYEWCHKQTGFGKDGFELDKDILIKGNRVYSEDTCVFVPREINILFTKRQNFRGKCCIGVHFNKRLKKYMAQCSRAGSNGHLGYYKTEVEAFLAYKAAKEKQCKILAEKHKAVIDTRTYNALQSYEVCIDD